MEGILCFLSGLMIGAAVGYMVAAVMQAAHRSSREEGELSGKDCR